MNTAQVKIPTADGSTVLEYTVHKFSPLDGRAIVAGYPLSILNKEFTYKANEQAALSLMAYVSVGEGDDAIHLNSNELINQHIPDWWTMVQLEYACLRHNCSFLEKVGFLDAVKSGLQEQLRYIIADHLERIKQ